MNGRTIEQFLGGNVAPLAPAGEEPLGTTPQGQTLLWPERIKHLSASSIGMFRRCPEQFRHRYILGEKERPGESLVIGSAFHEGLEFNYRQKIESHTDRPTAEVVQYLQDEAIPNVLEEEGGEDEIVWDSDAKKGVATMRKDSERMLVRYHDNIVPRIQPVALEEELFVHHDALPVPIIGYIDVRAGTEVQMDTTSLWVADRVIDTKTGKQSSSKLKPSWQLQATLYSAMTNLPVEYHSISRAASPKIVTGLESEEMVFRPDPIKTANVVKTAATVASMIAWLYTTLGPDETWPTMGRFADWSMSFSPCTNCGWRKVCPAMAGEL